MRLFFDDSFWLGFNLMRRLLRLRLYWLLSMFKLDLSCIFSLALKFFLVLLLRKWLSFNLNSNLSDLLLRRFRLLFMFKRRVRQGFFHFNPFLSLSISVGLFLRFFLRHSFRFF